MSKKIGLLTAGSDCSGLNAAIRAIGKAGIGAYEMQIIGFQDGFKGLIEDSTLPIESKDLSGILTSGGTILGTSRDQPYEMTGRGQVTDLMDQAVETYRRHELEALVCIGGRETQASALRLAQKGLNIITLPKAIDNDIEMTDASIGFDTAVEIAAQSIDRLHSTAHSNHRIIIVEVMGRNTGWLALGAGIAGGADVILIPEIPYDINKVAEAIMKRSKAGKSFSIVAVSERIVSQDQVAFGERLRRMNARLRSQTESERVAAELTKIESQVADTTVHLSNRLKDLTGLETRMTILGYLLRGGAPSATDRLLAAQLGTACVSLINQGRFGVMVAMQSCGIEAVPLEQVVGKHKAVPLDHQWVMSARRVGTHMGD